MGKYAFGRGSQDAMRGVHPDLIRVMGRALSFGVMDFSLSHGTRTIDEQREYVRQGKSQTMDSMHLIQDDGWAHAIHAVPYPQSVNGRGVWDDLPRFGVLAGLILAAATIEQVGVRWGGDWDGDGNNDDSNFLDAAHWELV